MMTGKILFYKIKIHRSISLWQFVALSLAYYSSAIVQHFYYPAQSSFGRARTDR